MPENVVYIQIETRLVWKWDSAITQAESVNGTRAEHAVQAFDCGTQTINWKNY